MVGVCNENALTGNVIFCFHIFKQLCYIFNLSNTTGFNKNIVSKPHDVGVVTP